MENQILGGAVLLAGALAVLAAYRNARASRPAVACACLAVLAILLRVYAGTDRSLHRWDESYHAVVAKHLMREPFVPTLYPPAPFPSDPLNWTRAHVWVHKPPLALWLMAASMKAFGVSEVSARLPDLLLSALAVWLTWAIARRWFGDRVALVATFIHASNGLLIELASGRRASDHVDSLLIILVEAAVAIVALTDRPLRWSRTSAVGICLGLALLTKSLPGLLIVPVWLALAWPSRRDGSIGLHLAWLLAIAAVVAAPWYIYIFQRFPAQASAEMLYTLRHVGEQLEGQATSPFFYVLQVPRYFGELIYLPLAWVAAMAVRRRVGWHAWVLIVWIAVPFVVFSVATTKMPAYIATAAPALFIAEGMFVVAFLERRGWRAVVAAAVLVVSLKYMIEAVRPLRRRDRNPEWAQTLRALPARTGTSRGVLMAAPHPIETMFYTDFVAYPETLPAATIVGLQQQGYAIFTCAASDLPASGVVRIDCAE